MRKDRINTVFMFGGILLFFIVGYFYSDFIMAISIGMLISTITNIIVTRFRKK